MSTESLQSHTTSEQFDTNIAAYEQMTPDEQREYLEAGYDDQEKNELPFRAATVLKLGNIALELPEPTLGQDTVENEETEQVEEQEEVDFDQYLAKARQIIARLFMGDMSALSGLPPEFQDALKSRMEYRKKQLEDESISEGEMEEELDKMSSVASVGLAKMLNPDL